MGEDLDLFCMESVGSEEHERLKALKRVGEEWKEGKAEVGAEWRW